MQPGIATHPSFAGIVRMTSEQLPDHPDLATARTIEAMARYAREDAVSPQVEQAFRQAIVPLLAQASPRAAASLIFAWVKRHVRYQLDPSIARGISPAPAPDPLEVELLIRPRDLLRMQPPTGDCDDFSMLTAALLMRAGIGCEFVTIAADAATPDQFTHVYVYAIVDGQRIALDTSHGRTAGWEHPAPTRRQTWPIATPPHTLAGLADGAQDELTGGSGSFWQNLITRGVDISGQIFTRRYGVPGSGTYEEGPGGVAIRSGYGSSFNFPSVGAGYPGGNISTGTLLIVGAVALAGLLLLAKASR